MAREHPFKKLVGPQEIRVIAQVAQDRPGLRMILPVIQRGPEALTAPAMGQIEEHPLIPAEKR